MSIPYTVTLNLTPAELAAAFCEMCGDEQAAFFAAVGKIAATWPGAGMCQQGHDIAKHLDGDGRNVIEVIAGHAGMIPDAADPTPAIFVRFSDDGQHIRKWSFEPFEAGARYIAAFEPSWDNPDGPQAA